MRKDERDLLEVLKCELEFLERGLYRHSPRFPWRPQFFLEDSPSCPNYDAPPADGPCRCAECALAALVPPEFQNKSRACRHIPLNSDHETLDSLYRSTDLAETEQVFRDWLRATITRLERERQALAHGPHPAPLENERKPCEPLFQKGHPKCANPACHAAFQWRGGGRFFRFRPEPASDARPPQPVGGPSAERYGRHYWLCERCSHIFTLVFDRAQGVVLKLRAAEIEKESGAPRPVSG